MQLLPTNPCLNNFRKNQRNKVEIFSRKHNSLIKGDKLCQEARVKLTNAKLNKLKSAAKNNSGTTLRITKKKFQDDKLSHELFQTTR